MTDIPQFTHGLRNVLTVAMAEETYDGMEPVGKAMAGITTMIVKQFADSNDVDLTPDVATFISMVLHLIDQWPGMMDHLRDQHLADADFATMLAMMRDHVDQPLPLVGVASLLAAGDHPDFEREGEM